MTNSVNFPRRLAALAMLCFAVALASCAPLIAGYDIEAYKTATTLKAETDMVLSRGAEPYADNREKIEALTVKLNAAREYAAGIPRNGNSARQWELMVDPNQGLAGGTLRMWRERGKLNPIIVEEQRKQIAEGFNYIICLEANKQKASKCTVQAAAASTEGD
jgi:hypothetical protein